MQRRDVLKMKEKHGKKMSREALIVEAKLQTDAIQRLNVWLRLGYSFVAVGFILGLWGMQGGPAWGVPAGVVCLVIGAPISIILKIGTTNAHKNVERILAAAGVDVEELKRHKMGESDSDEKDGGPIADGSSEK